MEKKFLGRDAGLLALGVGLGTAAMYSLDPRAGRRRRHVMRDKMAHSMRKGSESVRRAAADASHRMKGMVLETTHGFRNEEVEERVLEERVRSRLGRVVSHPGSMNVRAENGRVILSGKIISAELDEVLDTAASTRGVREVENQLNAMEVPNNEPGLQGEGSRPGTPRLFLRRGWGPAERAVAGAAGGLMSYLGFRRGGPLGNTLTVAGFGLLTRAITNLDSRRLLGLGRQHRGIDFQKTVHVDATVSLVYETLRNVESFPRFMSHVFDVERISEDRTRWYVEGPAGATVTWDAEIVRDEAEKVIEWQSLPGSVIRNAGSLRFEEDGEGGTRVHIRMTYNPPAGGVGHVISTLLGANPKRELDDDMLRMKTYLERGRAPRDAARPGEHAQVG